MIAHFIKHKKLFNSYFYFSIRFILLTYFLFGLIQNNYSQTYPYSHFTVKDGLPSSLVYHVFQDSKGYIWFATENGVSRYDGYEFKNFSKSDGLPDNTVFEIIEDSKNRVWFMPHSIKLSYFYNDSIYEYKYNGTIQSITKEGGKPRKQMFYVDSSDNVYFHDKQFAKSIIIDSLGRKHIPNNKEISICYYLIEDFLFQRITLPHQNQKDRPNTYRILKDGKEIFKKQIFYNEPPKKYQTGISCGVKKDSNYFIVDSRFLLHIQDSVLISTKQYDEIIIWASTDNLNNLWLGTYDGVYCYHNYNINNKPVVYLKGKAVSSVLSDNEGGYWFSTLQNGVYYLPNIHTKTLRKNDGLKSNIVTTLEHDSTTLWMGFNLNYIQGLTGNLDNKGIVLSNYIKIVYNLLYDHKKQNLWIGADKLNQYNKSTSKSLEIKYLDKWRMQARGLFIDINNDVWIGSRHGLLKYSFTTKKLKKQGNFNYKINTLCQASNDKILMGCNNGLWEYSKITGDFQYLGEKDELLENKITCIIYNKFHGNYWIGTSTDGIIIYEKGTIYNISTKEGLSNNNVTSFFLKDNIMWVTTNNGLNKIHLNNNNAKNNFRINTYSTIHGLASNETNDIYVNDSVAYIATQNGLTITDYNTLKRNTTPPTVYIKKIKIQGTDTIIQQHYNLPYYKNSINIEYVGLMYRNHENKKYKYRLNQPGKQASWTGTPDNYANFSYLPPGKYNFQIIAVNEDGYESKVPATIGFTINPPYWKTWWFISLMVFASLLFILIMVYITYKVRINEINKRNTLEKNLLQEINKYRQQALSQQMNPHFIFNTLNSIQYYIYENDHVSSTRYLAKFSKLVRLILDNSQHDTITIKNELKAIELYLQLEAVRLKNKFRYRIHIHKNININLYRIYPLLIQPYIENSIWHGLVHKKGEKYVSISIKPMNSYILCIIEDNGIGREKAMEIKKQKRKKHKSLGTKITNKRIDTINKLFHQDFNVEYIDLKDDKGNACGTKVLLKIPKILT